MYFFVSLIAIFISLGAFLMNSAYNGSIDIGIFLLSLATAFVPFVSTLSIAIPSFSSAIVPVEVSAIISVISLIISFVQTFILAMVVLQIIHNVIWNPDV